MGYEDLNDHEELRHDPMFALALQKRIGLENELTALAGKSTLNRLEHFELFSDRTSTHTFAGNQLRLWFSSIAYVLMNAFRQQCLAKTELQNAQVGTIRTKLLKLGAVITVSARRILIAISSSSPFKHIWAVAYRCLKMLPNTANCNPKVIKE